MYFIRYKTPADVGAAVGGAGPAAFGVGPGGIDYSSGGGDIGSNTVGTDYAPGPEYGAPSY